MKNILNNFSSSGNGPTVQNNMNSNDKKENCNAGSKNSSSSDNQKNYSKNTNTGNNSTASGIPEFDLDTILKLKSIMDSLNSKNDDPRSNLLLSLKPYLTDSKKEKVDQYIKFLNLARVIDALNPMGGDKNKNV